MACRNNCHRRSAPKRCPHCLRSFRVCCGESSTTMSGGLPPWRQNFKRSGRRRRTPRCLRHLSIRTASGLFHDRNPKGIKADNQDIPNRNGCWFLRQGGTVNDCSPLIVFGREKLVLGGTGGGFELPVGFAFFRDIPQIGRVVSGRDCPQGNLD